MWLAIRGLRSQRKMCRCIWPRCRSKEVVVSVLSSYGCLSLRIGRYGFKDGIIQRWVRTSSGSAVQFLSSITVLSKDEQDFFKARCRSKDVVVSVLSSHGCLALHIGWYGFKDGIGQRCKGTYAWWVFSESLVVNNWCKAKCAFSKTDGSRRG